MSGKLLSFPTATATASSVKGGDATTTQPPKRKHIVRRRLDEMGKDVKWLAGEMRVTTPTLYNFFNHRSELKAIHFNRMLKVLGISLNYYYGVGQYARSSTTSRIRQTIDD